MAESGPLHSGLPSDSFDICVLDLPWDAETGVVRYQRYLGHRDMMICKHAVVQSASCNTTDFIHTSFQTDKASEHLLLLTSNLLPSIPGQTRNKFPLLSLLCSGVTQPKWRLALMGRALSLKCLISQIPRPLSLREREWERGQHRPQEEIWEEGKENTFLLQISKCRSPVPTNAWHTCKCVYVCSCIK